MTTLHRNKVATRFAKETREVGIGVIVPHDFVLDHELWRFLPPNVTLHITRTNYRDLDVSTEMAEWVSSEEEVTAAVRQLEHAAPRVVAYACTSGSYVNGAAGETRLRQVMETAGARIASTTSGALLAALQNLEVRRVAIATPYNIELTRRLEDFLSDRGHEVVGISYLDLHQNIHMVDNETVLDLATRANSLAAEAVFISCTNLRTFDTIGPLEAKLDKPVISANQVTMWAALQAAAVYPDHVRHLLFSMTHPPVDSRPNDATARHIRGC